MADSRPKQVTLRRQARIPHARENRLPFLVGAALLLLLVTTALDAALWRNSHERVKLQQEVAALEAQVTVLKDSNRKARAHVVALQKALTHFMQKVAVERAFSTTQEEVIQLAKEEVRP